MEIAVEEVKALMARLDEINKIPLNEIVWTENGKPLEICAKIIEEWRFVGLSNSYFINDGIYLLKETMWEEDERYTIHRSKPC